MDVWQAVNSVRVIRDFADRPLAPEHLDRILNAARRTASSKNQQEWAFIVVRDREHLKELTRVGRYADHLAGAAVAIALITPDRAGSTLPWDLGRAAQDMVLVAWELGIGSVPATCHNKQITSELLGLPADQRCDFILSFGYPADQDKLTAPNRAGGRVALDSIIHDERW